MPPDHEKRPAPDTPTAPNSADDTSTTQEYQSIRCDSCGLPLGADEGQRWRHRYCAAVLPAAALDAIERAHRIGGRR